MTRTRRARSGHAIGRLVPWLLVLVLTVLVGILLLPAGIRHGLEWWLAKHSGGMAVVEDVDFDILTGDLVIQDVRIARDGQSLLSIGDVRTRLSLRPLWRRELRATGLGITDALIEVRQTEDGRVGIGGISAEKWRGSWPLSVSAVNLGNIRLSVVLPEFVGELEFAELHGRDVERSGMDDGGVRWGVWLQGSGAKLRGRIAPDNGAAGGIDVSGVLNGQSHVRLQGRPGGEWELATDGTLTVDGLNMVTGASVISEQLLSWTGISTARWKSGEPETVFRAQGRLTGLQSELAVLDEDLRSVQDNLLWEGWLEAGRGGGAAGLRMNADAAADRTRIETVKDGKILAAVEALQLWGIVADGKDRVRIGEIWLGPIQATEHQTAQTGDEAQESESFSISGISARHVQWRKGERLDIGNLQLRNLSARIVRDEQGRWQGPAGPGAAFIGNLTRIAAAKEIAWRIGALETAGASHVQFEDRQMQPTYSGTFEPFRLLVENLDSATPQQPSHLYVRTSMADGAAIDLSASVRPLADDFSLDMTGQVSSMSLASLSPYSARCMGYGFSGGELEGEFILYVNKGELWSSARLALERPAIWIDSPESAQQVADSLGMPLQEALASLQDSTGRIGLRLGVSGSLDEPAFDFCTELKNALVGFLGQRLQQDARYRSADAKKEATDLASGEAKKQ